MLRKVLRAIGLSQRSADEAVDFVVDRLAGEHEQEPLDNQQPAAPIYPYLQRDHFLSPAEMSFYGVLRLAVDGQAAICAKVSLSDLFYVRKDDPSRYRIYTNKIDRKHVDFLLCDPATLRPLLGIELDDKSHRRPDRQQRDAFVDQVFGAAGLPLLHIPAQHAYRTEEIRECVAPYLSVSALSAAAPVTTSRPQSTAPVTKPLSSPPLTTAQTCPKCGCEMILRTAKKGARAGQQFWGCSNYPTCRTMLPFN